MSAPPKISVQGQDKPANFVSEFYCFNTPNEFIISLIDIIPQMKYLNVDQTDPSGKMSKVARISNDGLIQQIVGRFGMSPAAFKKLTMLLNQNLNKYEKKYGEIMIQPPEFMH